MLTEKKPQDGQEGNVLAIVGERQEANGWIGGRRREKEREGGEMTREKKTEGREERGERKKKSDKEVIESGERK